jgi:hypothetical protein
MALSSAKGGAGALLNELFAVAEKPEQESASFSLSGNLFGNPNWAPQDTSPRPNNHILSLSTLYS